MLTVVFAAEAVVLATTIWLILNTLLDDATATAANTTVSIYTNGAVAQGSAPSGGTAFPVASTISVPGNASLIVVDKTTAIYLQEGTSITVTSGTASSLTYSISYEDIT